MWNLAISGQIIMGLFYHTMINEVREDFKNQNFPLEAFLLANFDKYQEKYKLSTLLMYLNFHKISEEEKIDCPILDKKLSEVQKEDWNE